MEPLRRSSSLSEQVLGAIRAAIASGEWAPGEIHSAAQVAAQLGVSRTPAREALLKLAEAGLIRFERNVGFRVVGNSPRSVLEVLHMRLLLEPAAVRLTASNHTESVRDQLVRAADSMREAALAADPATFALHDRRFHELLVSSAGNDRLATTVVGLRDATMAPNAHVDHNRDLVELVAEHEPILEAVIARDPDGAAAAVVEHLVSTANVLLSGRSQIADDVSLLPFVADLFPPTKRRPTSRNEPRPGPRVDLSGRES